MLSDELMVPGRGLAGWLLVGFLLVGNQVSLPEKMEGSDGT